MLINTFVYVRVCLLGSNTNNSLNPEWLVAHTLAQKVIRAITGHDVWKTIYHSMSSKCRPFRFASMNRAATAVLILLQRM